MTTSFYQQATMRNSFNTNHQSSITGGVGKEKEDLNIIDRVIMSLPKSGQNANQKLRQKLQRVNKNMKKASFLKTKTDDFVSSQTLDKNVALVTSLSPLRDLSNG